MAGLPVCASDPIVRPWNPPSAATILGRPKIGIADHFFGANATVESGAKHTRPGMDVGCSDSAEIAQIELVGSEYDPNAEANKPSAEAAKPKKGVGDRLKAAAQRMRGKKEEGKESAPKAHTKAAGGKKVTTPRKAGGS